MKPLPTPEELRKLLRHEPENSLLFWRVRTPDMFAAGNRTAESNCKGWNKKYAGKEAFCQIICAGHNLYYKTGCILRTSRVAHRVIWAMVHGEWPADQIDHINHNGLDNRIENLRAVSNLENSRNQSMSKINTSGATGVIWTGKNWRARIGINGVKKDLGRFVNLSDAVKARDAAKQKYGYHANHGKQL